MEAPHAADGSGSRVWEIALASATLYAKWTYNGSSSGGGTGVDYNQVVGGTYENVGNNGQTIANIATSMLGVSYVWGACSSSAVDCSGLVCYAYAQLGVALPHYSGSLTSVGVSVPRDQVMPGDIICWDSGDTVDT